MKALILSFFAVILGYSLIFDEKKTTDQPVIKDSNSVHVDRPANMQMSDSIMIYRDRRVTDHSKHDNNRIGEGYLFFPRFFLNYSVY